MPNPKITLTGNIGQDPEPIGNNGLRLRVATNDRIKDESGNYKDGETSWWTVKLWKNQAEYGKNVLKKGQQVTVVGTIVEETWTDKNTNSLRSTYGINADSVAVTAFTLNKNQSSVKSANRFNDDIWNIDSPDMETPF